jgi:hypothetical protein
VEWKNWRFFGGSTDTLTKIIAIFALVKKNIGWEKTPTVTEIVSFFT